MGGVRALELQDLPRIVDLYRRVFADASGTPDGELAAYFQKIYFDHPWYDDRLPSLVYDHPEAGIIGFLGVTPRPLIFRDAQIQSAVTSTFMVDPSHRRSLAAISLLRSFFSGPQDLSIAEGNDMSRKLWLALGGTVSLVQGVHLVCPLRPVGYILNQAGLPGILGSPADWLIARTSRGPFRRSEPGLVSEELTESSSFLECVDSFGRAHSLRPLYTAESVRWLFELLERKRRYGRLRKVLLRDESGKAAGWHVWYQKRNGVARVVQVVAREKTMPDVLSHLAYRAWKSRAVALSARLDPQLLRDIPSLVALFGRGFSWMLIHGRDRGIHRAIQTGDALFTRLEGEWWAHYAEME